MFMAAPPVGVGLEEVFDDVDDEEDVEEEVMVVVCCRALKRGQARATFPKVINTPAIFILPVFLMINLAMLKVCI